MAAVTPATTGAIPTWWALTARNTT
jgi:hypothetical protein